jgi:hypothetical protein
MVRECAASLLLLPVAGCSYLLDFSDQAIPRDAAPDAPYVQAECDYKEPNDSAATAARITAADTGPAAICAAAGAAAGAGPEDHDFYRFTVPAQAARVEVKITYTYRPTGDLDLKLYGRTGEVVAESRGFGDTEVISCPGSAPACPALSADDYVFEVFPAVTGAVNAYTFALAVTAM